MWISAKKTNPCQKRLEKQLTEHSSFVHARKFSQILIWQTMRFTLTLTKSKSTLRTKGPSWKKPSKKTSATEKWTKYVDQFYILANSKRFQIWGNEISWPFLFIIMRFIEFRTIIMVFIRCEYCNIKYAKHSNALPTCYLHKRFKSQFESSWIVYCCIQSMQGAPTKQMSQCRKCVY